MPIWKTRSPKLIHLFSLPGPVMLVALGMLAAGCSPRALLTIASGPGAGGRGDVADGSGKGGGVASMGGAIGTGGLGVVPVTGTGGATAPVTGDDPMNIPPAGTPAQVTTVAGKLDLLLMVDNSSSMAPLQAKLAAELPSLLSALRNAMTGQYPDLHIGVVSSSMGAGDWGNVNQCAYGAHPGDDEGALQQGPGGAGSGACPMLHAGQKFLANGDGTAASLANFDGDIGTAVQCMALLGDDGCGFESQFKSVVYALNKAADPLDPDNAGFLRSDARLAIVMLTNEDDCSVSNDSLLLDPAVNSALDPTGLGSLQSYRCNEFGHLCGGFPPPHGYDLATQTSNLATGTYRSAAGPGSGGVILNGCISADGAGKTDPLVLVPDGPEMGMQDPSQGHLFGTIPSLIAAIKSYKSNPNDVFVAAIAGPTADANGSSLYRVFAQDNPAANGELDPVVDHSCVQASATGGDPEYADPAVRIKQLVDGFGQNAIFYPICANDFSTAEQGLASGISAMITR